MSRRTSHVLVCLRYGIGDLIMELPALDALHRALPEAVFTGLGAEPAIEILEGDGRFDEVVSIRRWGIRHLGDSADEEAQRAFVDWLTSGRFDLIFDPSHAAHILRPLINGAGVETRDACPAYLDEGLALGMDGLSAVKRAAQLGWGLAVPVSSCPAVLLREEEIDWARRFLKERGMAHCVGMSPGASEDLKRWPIYHYAHLCHYVTDELGAPVLLFGGPTEADLLGALIESTKTANPSPPYTIEAVDGLHLRRVAALLSQCRLYVGNDSGLMHLAAAVGTPVVALFGPTAPRIYLPTWVRARAVASSVACTHQPRRVFGHPRCALESRCFLGAPCIMTITPADVCAAVGQEYGNPAPVGGRTLRTPLT